MRTLFGSRSLSGGAIATLLVNLAGTLLSYGSTVMLARTLNASSFGVYSFVLSLALILVLPAQFGLPMLIVREVAGASRRGDWGRVRGLIAWARRFVVVGTILIAAVGLIVFTLVPSTRGGSDLASLLWGLLLVPILGLIGVESAILRGSFRVSLSQVPDRVLRQALQICLLLGAWALHVPIQAAGALAITAISGLAALAFAGAMVRRHRQPEVRTAVPESASRQWIASAVPLGLVSGLAALSAAAGPVILGYVAAPVEAGSFRIASQFALLGGLAYTTLVSVLVPRFAAAQGDVAELARLNRSATRVATAVAVCCLAGFAGLGSYVIGILFGAEYAGVELPTVILLAGAVLNAAFGFASAILIMGQGERTVWRCLCLSTTLMLVGSIPAGAVYGATGVAAVSAAATLLANVLVWRSAKREIGVNTLVR